jgi:hypothetical protein
MVYPELWFVNSLKLKVSRDLVYEAIAKSAGFTYNSVLEVFQNNQGCTFMSSTVDGQWKFKSPKRETIYKQAFCVVVSDYKPFHYFRPVMTLAREK